MMRKWFIYSLLFGVLLCKWSFEGQAQNVAIKTNLLYGALGQAPNLGMELRLAPRWTLDFGGGYNPWNRTEGRNDNRKMVHWVAQLELRYWLCQSFSGHYFGVHPSYARYNISRHHLPLVFGKDSKEYRYDGTFVGGGFSYGYQLPLSKHWNIDFNIGFGAGMLRYDRYECVQCALPEGGGKENRTYVGPTRAGISFMYFL